MRVMVMLSLSLVVFAGCGYTWAGAGLGGAGSIAVRTPANESYEPGLELMVADALRREVLRRDGGALIEDPARADLVISGRVLPVDRRARSFSATVLALEEEVALSLELEAVRRDGSRVALPEGALRETERYLTSADIEAHRKNREEAMRRLAGLLASRFFDALGEAAVR